MGAVRPIDLKLSADANQLLKIGTDGGVFAQTLLRSFASDTAVAPASPGHPTSAEIATWATGQSVTNAVVYYTGTDTSTDEATHSWIVAGDGSVQSITPQVRGFTKDPIFWVATQITEDPWASPWPVTITQFDIWLETTITASGAVTLDLRSGATSLLVAPVDMKALSAGWNSIALVASTAVELTANETLTVELDASDPLNTDMSAGAIFHRIAFVEA